MSELVETIRKTVKHQKCGISVCTSGLLTNAADKIERLRKALAASEEREAGLTAKVERLSEQLARMEPSFVARNEYAAAIIEELTETACAKGYCDIVECVNESPVRVERAEVFQHRTDNDKGEPSALGAPRPTSKSAARRALDGEE